MKGFNRLVQGSASDLIQDVATRTQDFIDNRGWADQVVLQVHDETVIEADPDHTEEIEGEIASLEKEQSSIKQLIAERVKIAGAAPNRLTRPVLGWISSGFGPRIHPIHVLSALLIYQNGGGYRGKLTWDTVPHVVDALDGAFYDSFKFVEPTGKRILIGLDVSGSMTMHPVNGLPFLDARMASAAMCMTTARTEANWHVMAFTSEFVPVSISPRQRLDDVVRTTSGLRFGATDCAMPMAWAHDNKVEVDAFVIYTDNETWYGTVHPCQALDKYRQATGIPAKLIVNAMTATEFSIARREGRGYGTIYRGTPNAIADPNDAGMLDVAGLDSAAPKVMSDFIRD